MHTCFTYCWQNYARLSYNNVTSFVYMCECKFGLIGWNFQAFYGAKQ